MAGTNREQQETGDPYRPVYHLAPPSGWMNDPNGLAQAGGTYHFFYQHFPDRPEPGPMHWGHAVSTDLLRWRHEPVALAPDTPADIGGCWSGSAVVTEGGRLALLYTGLDGEGNQAQCLAFADDPSNTTFTKFGGNPVVTAPEGVPRSEFRDPKVWRHGDAWYMVVGSSSEGRGALQLYSSRDLKSWSHLGVAARAGEGEGRMWECPDLFPLADGHVLVFSPIQRHTLGIVGDMDYDRGEFTKDRAFILDYGPDFYAPQTFIQTLIESSGDENARRILVGWMANWGSAKGAPTKEYGWAGALTVPRVMTLLEDGTLAQTPVPEIETLRREHREFGDVTVREGESGFLGGLSGAVMEIAAEFDLGRGGARKLGLRLRRSGEGEEETLVYYDMEEQSVVLDRMKSGAGVAEDDGTYEAPLPLQPGTKLRLHILMDRSSVEVFTNEGRVVLTARVYPTRGDSTGVDLFAEGGTAALTRLDAWRLG